MTTERRPNTSQHLSATCANCGLKILAVLRHYDIVTCQCGARYWALQPKRDGVFKLVAHPGSAVQPQNQE